MTQRDTLIAALQALGIEPLIETQDHTGLDWVTLEAKQHIGGYSGFVVNFGFDREGRYVPEASGIWE